MRSVPTPRLPKPKPRQPKATPRRDPPPEPPTGEPEPDQASAAAAGAEAGEVPETAAAPSAPVDQPGDAVRRRRDALVEPLVPDVVRASKRLLQDEQNSLLDNVRRARGRLEADRLLPEPERQRETWTALLAPSIDAAYVGGRAAAGKSGRVTSAPERLLAELAALLVMPLRERVSTTIESAIAMGPYDDANELLRELGSAIGARFREWRAVRPRDPRRRRARGGVRPGRVRRCGARGDAAVGAGRPRALSRLRRQRARAHAEGQGVPDRAAPSARASRMPLHRRACRHRGAHDRHLGSRRARPDG